jgi:hypothetical protein
MRARRFRSPQDELVLKTGAATITMKKNGDITIEGKTITIKGSGDIIIEGQRVLQNYLRPEDVADQPGD